MGRNKYPEETRARILEVALRLFCDQGYENTTIQDIVNGLGGMTKGAVYHHFKGKEDILSALTDKLFLELDPAATARRQTGLNGLEKLRYALTCSYASPEAVTVNQLAVKLLKEPRFLAESVASNRDVLSPMLQGLIEDGIADGSIPPVNARYLAETAVLLLNFWTVPSVYPTTAQDLVEKMRFTRALFEGIGVNLFTDELMAECEQGCAQLLG